MKKYNRYVDKFNRTLEIYNETTDEKESKKLNFLLVRIKKKLEELKSQEITEEQALKYFSKHFEEEKNEQANDDKQETKNSTKNSMEKNFC